jgi:hypothetical protein
MKKLWLIPWVMSAFLAFGQDQTIPKGGGGGGGSGTNGVNSFNGRQGNVSLLIGDVPPGLLNNSVTGNAATAGIATNLAGFSSNQLFYLLQLSTNNGASLTNLQGAAIVGAVLQSTYVTTAQLTNHVLASNVDSGGQLSPSVQPALTGDVTSSAGSTATTIAAGAVTASKIANNTITSNQMASATLGTNTFSAATMAYLASLQGAGGSATNAIGNTNGIGDSTTLYRFLVLKGNFTNVDGQVTGTNDVTGSSWQVSTNGNFGLVVEAGTITAFNTNWFIYLQTNGCVFGMTNSGFWVQTSPISWPSATRFMRAPFRGPLESPTWLELSPRPTCLGLPGAT